MDFSMWDVDLAQRRRRKQIYSNNSHRKISKNLEHARADAENARAFSEIARRANEKKGNLHSQTGCRLKDWQRRRKPGTFHKNFH
jgi:hypothetical protein